MGTASAIPCLAQVSSEDVTSILIWSGVLVGLVIVLGIVMVMAKRQSGTEQNRSAPFTLGELRKMRDAGQLSDEEYQATRNQMVGMAKANLGGEDDSASQRDIGGIGSSDAPRPRTNPSEGQNPDDQGEPGSGDGDRDEENREN